MGSSGVTGRAAAWTRAEALRVIEAWARSGETGAAYAKSIGVLPQRLFQWRRRLGPSLLKRRGRALEAAAEVTLVPVVAMGPSDTARPIVVTTATGVRVEVIDANETTAAWVAAFVMAERGES